MTLDEFWSAYDWPECDAGCDLPAIIENEFDKGVFLNLCWLHGIEDLVVEVADGTVVKARHVPWLETHEQ